MGQHQGCLALCTKPAKAMKRVLVLIPRRDNLNIFNNIFIKLYKQLNNNLRHL
jgi:hypothetical protein